MNPPRVSGSPARIGPYSVVSALGRGGAGVVYKAIDPSSGSAVAIKVLSGHGVTPERRQRFDREARALAKVRHSHVVRLRDVGEDECGSYLVLDYHEEGSLEDLLESGPLHPTFVTLIGRQLASGLAAAHSQGVLHRDLKPANVLIGSPAGRNPASDDPVALLTDFGLAKDLSRLGETQGLSRSGLIMGTPGFWAPEQVAGEPGAIGPAADVYGLGAVLYAALTGRPPIVGETVVEILVATTERPPAGIRTLRPDVPVELEAVVMRCLEKDPAARWRSAEELGRALQAQGLLNLPASAAAPRRSEPPSDSEVAAGRSEAGERPTGAAFAIAGLALGGLLLSAIGAMSWAKRQGPEVAEATPTPAIDTARVERRAAEAKALRAEARATQDLLQRRTLYARAAAVDPQDFESDMRVSLLDLRAARGTPGEAGLRKATLARIDETLQRAGSPEQAALVNYLACLAHVRGSGAGVKELVQRRLQSASKASPRGVWGLLAQARLHERAFEVRAARAFVERAVLASPMLFEAVMARGQIAASEGDFVRALSDARRAMDLDAMSPEAHVLHALARFHVNRDRAGALRDLAQALELDPSCLSALACKVYVRLERSSSGMIVGDSDEARVEGEHLVKADPGLVYAQIALAEVFMSNSLYGVAHGHADRAVAASGGLNVAALMVRSRIRMRDGNLKGALEDTEVILSLDPNHARALANKGAILVQGGKRVAATLALERALEIDPSLSAVWRSLGSIYMKSKPRPKLRQAVEAFTKSLELDPGSASGYFNRGVCYYEMQSFQHAVRDLDRSLTLRVEHEPGSTQVPLWDVHYVKAHCHYAREDWEKAKQAFTVFLDKAPAGHRGRGVAQRYVRSATQQLAREAKPEGE
jgi:tetratricopeptide (TPR) repeat protein